MKKFILGLSVVMMAAGNAQANSFNDAIITALNEKYTKKYDSWEELGSDVTTIKGLMASNCENLEASWCKRIITSISNIEPPSSRPQKIITRAGKACKAAGGRYRTGYLSRNTAGLAASTDSIDLFLFENAEFISRRDYHATAYYGVCSDGETDKSLIMTMGVGRKIPDSNSAFSLVEKGNTFIYLVDMAAQSQKFTGLARAQENAESEFDNCMAGDLEPGNEVIYKGRKGMVVESKAPLVQVQMSDDLKWVKLADVRRDIGDCRNFVNRN